MPQPNRSDGESGLPYRSDQLPSEKPLPEDVKRILRKPGEKRTGKEKERVIEWLVQAKLHFLFNLARRTLYATYPGRHWDEDLIDNMVREALVDVFKSLHTYDLKRGASFLHWVCVILRNRCRRDGDKIANEVPIHPTGGDKQSVSPKRPTPGEDGAKKWATISSVRQMVNLLPRDYREPLQLSHLDEKSYQEIAQELRRSVALVRVQIHWALQMLRAYFDEEAQIIDCLPEPYRNALTLYRFQKLSYRDIAKRYHTTQSVAKERVQLAWQLYCLPDPYRQALIFYRLQKMSYTDIAKHHQTTEDIAKRLVDVAEQLKTYLEDKKRLVILPGPFRSVLILRCFREMTYAEIARNRTLKVEQVEQVMRQAWLFLLNHQKDEGDV